MNSAHPVVHLECSDGIAKVRLDNPQRKNALTLEMAVDLRRICDEIDDNEDIGAALISGSGSYFCSGADTRMLARASTDPSSPGAVKAISTVYEAFSRFADLKVVTIAAVEGGAVGAGVNLALAADVMIMGDGAVLDSGFLAKSLHPGGGHMALLGRRLSMQRVMAMAVLGEAVSSTEAVAIGLAFDAVPSSVLMQRAESLLKLAARDPELTRSVKRSARIELGPPGIDLLAALEVERGMQMWSFGRKGLSGWSIEGDQGRRVASDAP